MSTKSKVKAEVQQEEPTLFVDGMNFPIKDLPADLQELISIFQQWEVQLKTQKVESFKTEAAIRAVSSEIQTRIKALNATKEASVANDSA